MPTSHKVGRPLKVYDPDDLFLRHCKIHGNTEHVEEANGLGQRKVLRCLKCRRERYTPKKGKHRKW